MAEPCRVSTCLHPVMEGSVFCVMHDVVWGSPILTAEQVRRSIITGVSP